jgi:uncharacterized membrane protein
MARACASCGKEMGDDAAFCPACGKSADAAGAPGPSAGLPATAGAGLQSNLAAALSYLWITAIVFLLLEPYNRDRFVRFHAFQALFLGLASIAGHLVLSLIPFLGWMLMPVWSLLVLVLAIVAAVKAYQNETFSIPVIGPFAEKQV